MTYQQSRDEAQLYRLKMATDQFIESWLARPVPLAQRRTLFLLPGGMGSALWRATTPYQDNGPPLQHFTYDLNWATPCSFISTAPQLAIHQGVDGYRDTEDCIIIADGSVVLEGIDAYAGFRDWCDAPAQNIDVFTFGWDWRRSVIDAVDFFVTRFVPQFRAQVQQATGYDPMTNYTLVGHSFSGMFVNAFVRRSDIPGTCTRAIAVCGLFHGYGGQVHRWFAKDDMFALIDDMTMIRTVSSLPGCYQLPYLDYPTYSANKGKFSSPTNRFPLSAYPSVDAQQIHTPADPFHPKPYRYPTNTGFDDGELARGLAVFEALAQPLSDDQLEMFRAVRGIITDLAGDPVNTTAGSITWGHLPPGPYNPDENPIVDGPEVPGDGTLPAWSAYLIGSIPIDVCSPFVDHAIMLDLPATQDALKPLL